MAGSYSPYADAESASPTWKPGEEPAAAAFVGITLFLVIDVNVAIWRVFKRSTGLYYWSMKLGTVGVTIDAIGVILHFLMTNKERVWPLYTLMLLLGWTIYAPAQLLVLCSRFHLINENYRTRRWIFLLVIISSFLFITPTWIFAWPAYDINPKVSSVWSPREAIVERYNQIGFTLVECILSGMYIKALVDLLSRKPTVRQRRVMLDLVYVNIIFVTCDLVVVILLYLNQSGISHPIQTFSYSLKLKLEFVVLNQLMAVAARRVKREGFSERRYNHPYSEEVLSNQYVQCDDNPPPVPSKEHQADFISVTLPSPVLSRSHLNPRHRNKTDDGVRSDQEILGKGQKPMLHGFLEDDSESNEEKVELHMWEHKSTPKMQISWFHSKVEP